MTSVLTVNAGSSSLKLRLLGADDALLDDVELLAERGHVAPEDVARAVERLGEPDAVGHRIVHGGAQFTRAVRLDQDIVAALRDLTPLAPLHQPAALAALETVGRALPDVPAVACFDTAFHATLPAAAATYALPPEWRERGRVRRYGFHGLSHAYAARRAAELLARPVDTLRAVTCHLGAGASLAAIARGRSVDTTMGFTPTEGLVMATRSGDVDPGLLMWLVVHEGRDAQEIADGLEHRSGLLGLAGTADMREVLAQAADGAAPALLAREVYVHRLRALTAAMAAAMGGLDVLVFTGGVGEASGEIRRAAADGLGFLGVKVDARANEDATPDADVSADGAAVRTLVIRAREDVEIARQVRDVLGA
jgi:acetate kinase